MELVTGKHILMKVYKYFVLFDIKKTFSSGTVPIRFHRNKGII